MKGRRRLAAGLAALGSVALAGCAAAGAAPRADPPSCGAGSPRLTVQGSGTATATPDLLTLTFSVNVTDATAQAALADDNTRTAAVVGALRSGGVAASGIQTTGLSIQPDYVFDDGAEELTGYAVGNSIVAQLHDFLTAGSVIDAAVGAGGDAVQISSASFSLADPRPLQDQARLDAVRQAVSHAAAMAAAAGERLARVCSLTDQTSLPVNPTGQTDFAPAATNGTAVPLEAGTQQTSAQVSVVYALAPAPPAKPDRKAARSGLPDANNGRASTTTTRSGAL